jgi:hypothetical protein
MLCPPSARVPASLCCRGLSHYKSDSEHKREVALQTRCRGVQTWSGSTWRAGAISTPPLRMDACLPDAQTALCPQAAAMAATGHFFDFAALPAHLHIQIVSCLPLPESIRCALVARNWAALLADPAFWADLRFEGVAIDSVTGKRLLAICRRAKGRLRSLDVSDASCQQSNWVWPGLRGRGCRRMPDECPVVCSWTVVDVLSTEGIGLGLTSIRTWAPSDAMRMVLDGRMGTLRMPRDPINAVELRLACPALARAAVCVGGTSGEVVSKLGNLPGLGGNCVIIENHAAPVAATVEYWSALADSVCAALTNTPVHELSFLRGKGRGRAGDYPSMEAATARGIAAALAQGGSRMRRLYVNGGGSLFDGGGCARARACFLLCAVSSPMPRTDVHCPYRGPPPPPAARRRGIAILTALGSNRHLVEVEFGNFPWGDAGAIEALASALRMNSTLRKLALGSGGAGVPCVRSIIAAVCGSGVLPSRCALSSLSIKRTRLDLPACVALGTSLFLGARRHVEGAPRVRVRMR